MPVPVAPQQLIYGLDSLPANLQMVLGENGTAFVAYGPNAVSFNLSSGAVNWDYQAGTQSALSVMEALTGNEVDVNDSQNGIIHLDSSGNSSPIAGPSMGIQTFWNGQALAEDSTGTSQVQMPSEVPAASSSWALPAGNQSGNGLGVLQSLLGIPTNYQQHQLPLPGLPLNSNYNAIELLTSVSPADIFNTYLATFAGAGIDPTGNTVVGIVDAPPPPITASGQTVTFELQSFLNYIPDPLTCGQPGPPTIPCTTLAAPFSVQIERFDTSANTISAVTLVGHPLAGWRYWRVFSIGVNDVVIETGAVDTYAVLLLNPSRSAENIAGYYVFRQRQMKTWADDLRYIQQKLGAPQGSTPQYNVVDGQWNPQWPPQSYILNNVCQSTTCN